jgi:hypothetical protein
VSNSTDRNRLRLVERPEDRPPLYRIHAGKGCRITYYFSERERLARVGWVGPVATRRESGAA